MIMEINSFNSMLVIAHYNIVYTKMVEEKRLQREKVWHAIAIGDKLWYNVTKWVFVPWDLRPRREKRCFGLCV